MRTSIIRRTGPRRGRAAVALAPALPLALALALVTSAVPAIAKEGFQARLDAPIGRATPGGTTLLVGLTVTFPDGSVSHPVEGAPIELELVGRDGSSTTALGREDEPGHYVVRIQAPAGGISSVEVGARGAGGMSIEVLGTALVPGGITALTAGVAPALAAVATPGVRASAAPRAVVPPVAHQPVVEPAATPATSVPAPWLLAAAGLLGLIAGVVLTLVAVRRPRAPGHPTVTGRAPEA